MALDTRSWLLSLIVACMAASFTLAQDPGASGLEIASATGKFAAGVGNQIKITTENKEEILIVINKDTNLSYKGTADPKFLMPGLMVRFSTQLTKTGATAAPLKALEVFTLTPTDRPTPEQMREQTPGVYQEGGEIGEAQQNIPVMPAKPEPRQPAAKRADAKKNDKNAPKQAAVDPVNYRVVGQLLGNQGAKFFVNAGAVRIQVELDPAAVISVTSRELVFCQVGDEVKVSGLHPVGQEKYIQAETLQINGAKPLGPAEGKIVKNTKPSRTTRGAKDAAGADKPDAKKPNAAQPDAKKPAPKN